MRKKIKTFKVKVGATTVKERKRFADDCSRSTEQTKLLKKLYGGMEVIEAKYSIQINVQEEDNVGAIPHDAEHCVFAKTCTRMYGSSKVAFFGTTAYVDFEDEDGVVRVHRFIMSSRMQTAVAALDVSGGKSPPITGMYHLNAPSVTQRLDHKRARVKAAIAKMGKRKFRAKMRKYARNRAALIKAKLVVVKTKNKAGPLGVVRSGTGLVYTKKAA